MLRCILRTSITLAVLFGLTIESAPSTAQEARGQPDEIEATLREKATRLNHKVLCNRLHRGDAEIDAFIDFDPYILGSSDDVFTVHGCRKGNLLHLLAHTFVCQAFESIGGYDRVSDDKATELITFRERLIQPRRSRGIH